ncbi:hypothetical protein IV203_037789 [Nitzschia inconspicua]|uniref:Uncharacterized protein n=1 Tax=Nitzschia inconspicua TaxID=303405 RepID=A0A9K3PYG8_9STRA|nr:hypothetical protein IV203_037789 [Nitzschia inconspicua]
MEIPNAVYLQGSSSNAVSEEAASMETVLADTVVLMADEEAMETMRRPAHWGHQRLLVDVIRDTSRWIHLCCTTTFPDCCQEINNSQSNAHILDGNNKAFNCGRAYIPSGQAWVFSYIFKHVLPEFWGEPITSRLSLMSTDGCAQEYQAFIRNTGKGNTFPNAVHSLCSFHLAILGFNANVSCPAALSAGEQTKKALKIALDFVRSWAYYT